MSAAKRKRKNAAARKNRVSVPRAEARFEAALKRMTVSVATILRINDHAFGVILEPLTKGSP